jgi:hypothetical protein
MPRFVHATIFVAAFSATVVSSPLLDHSTTSVMGCGQDSCATGAAGQGGVASDGKAQGSHVISETHVGTMTQSGRAGASGLQTFDPVGAPEQIAAGKINPADPSGNGHFVNTIISGPTGVCNGHCPQ